MKYEIEKIENGFIANPRGIKRFFKTFKDLVMAIGSDCGEPVYWFESARMITRDEIENMPPGKIEPDVPWPRIDPDKEKAADDVARSAHFLSLKDFDLDGDLCNCDQAVEQLADIKTMIEYIGTMIENGAVQPGDKDWHEKFYKQMMRGFWKVAKKYFKQTKTEAPNGIEKHTKR